MRNSLIRKTSAAALCVLLCLSFASCKKSAQGDSDGADASDGKWAVTEQYFACVGKTAGEIADQYNIWDYEGRIGEDMYFRGLSGEYYVFDANDMSGTTLLSTSVCLAIVADIGYFMPEMSDSMNREELGKFLDAAYELQTQYSESMKMYYYYVETQYANFTVYVDTDNGDVAPDDICYLTRDGVL